jgi:hypothetical protein
VSLLDDVLPAQRYDETSVTNACRSLLQALTSPGAKEQPRLTVELGADEWRALEAQFRRPFRPHSSSKLLPVEGVGWVEFRRAKVEAVEISNPGVPAISVGHFRHWRDAVPAEHPNALDGLAALAERVQPIALLPEVAAAISEAKAERAAWTPDAVLAKGVVRESLPEGRPLAVPVVVAVDEALPPTEARLGGMRIVNLAPPLSDADGGVWKGDSK